MHVDYQTPDGRSFTDTQLVKVHPSPEALAERKRSRIETAGAKFSEATDGHSTPPKLRSLKVQYTVLDEENNHPTGPGDEPQSPHSINWTEDEIPRLR